MVERKFPLYLPVIMVIIVVLLCRNDLQSKESEITTYIVNNQDRLFQMASTALSAGTEVVPLIDGVNGISCWTGEETAVEFKYYSIGLGQTAGTHYGFYYSPQDIPVAYGAEEASLILGEDGWTWMGEDDSSGLTKKIMDHWYYYEVRF